MQETNANPEVIEVSESVETEPVTKDTISFKHLDKDVQYEWNKDVITPLVAKGHDYDFVKKQLDEYKGMGLSKSQIDTLRSFAGDKPIAEFINDLNSRELNQRIQSRASELVATEGLSEAHAKRMAELEIKQSVPTKPKEEVELENGFKELAKIFPETQNYQNLADFPKEFVDAVKEGTNILKAYTDYYVAEQKRQLEIERQNIENKLKSEGQLSSGQQTKQDPLGDALKQAILGK